MEDKKLLRIIEEAIKGDGEAFGALMRMKAKNILYIALSLTQDKFIAEDIAQEVVIIMNKKITTLKNAEAFDSWMYRIVFNACMYEKRKMSKVPKNIELSPEEHDLREERDEFLPEEYLLNKDHREELRVAVGELPQIYRMCLLLYFYEDMSYAEVAAAMDIKIQDVANILNRAKKKLRTSLALPSKQNETQTSDALTAGMTSQKTGGLAALPVLTQFFMQEADALIGFDVICRFNEGLAAQTGASTTAVAASVGTAVASGGAVFARIGARIALAAACGIGLLGLGFVAFGHVVSGHPFLNLFEGPTPSGQAQGNGAAASEGQTAPGAQPNDATPVLGPRLAEELDSFVEGEHENADAWRELAEEAQLVYVEHVLDGSYRYDVYMLDNEESQKRLIVISRIDTANNVGVAKKVGPLETPIPESTNIIAAFQEWKTADAAMDIEVRDMIDNAIGGKEDTQHIEDGATNGREALSTDTG